MAAALPGVRRSYAIENAARSIRATGSSFLIFCFSYDAPHLAFVFPGQGSQSVGMLAELAAGHPLVPPAFDDASAGACADLRILSQQGLGELLWRRVLARLIKRVDKSLEARAIGTSAELATTLANLVQV